MQNIKGMRDGASELNQTLVDMGYERADLNSKLASLEDEKKELEIALQATREELQKVFLPSVLTILHDSSYFP